MNFVYLSSLKIFKMTENVTSRKLKATEQSHLDARFATSESTHSTQLQGWQLHILKKLKLCFQKKFLKKITKKRHISKTTKV